MNAKSFVPGDPRINRRGRPRKGKTLTDALAKYAASKDEAGTRRGEVLAKKLFELAAGGDVAAIKYIYDRIDGKPVETVRAAVASGALPVFLVSGKESLEEDEHDADDTLETPAEAGPGPGVSGV
jgi:hypothetical protein